MEDNIFHKIIDKMKIKIQNRKQGYPSVSEYAFSPEEIASLNEQNKQKIQDLKQDLIIKPKKIEKLKMPMEIPSVRSEIKLEEKEGESLKKESNEESKEESLEKVSQFVDPVQKEDSSSIKTIIQIDKFDETEENVIEEKEETPIVKKIIQTDKITEMEELVIEENPTVKKIIQMDKIIEMEDLVSEEKEETPPAEMIVQMDEVKEKEMERNNPQNSFIHLNEKHQNLVMNKWQSINKNEIDKDIIEGKDLLNHNYTITYADNSAKYIHNIRKKYEIVLCYLIGFNNEKKGIYDKTIFSDKIDNEWKYLGNYIKLLEKIRNFKKN